MAVDIRSTANFGAYLKDRCKVIGARIKSDGTQDLYVAVVKATIEEETVPKEKHVRTLKIACSAAAPRQQVEYVAYKLLKRAGATPGAPHATWLATLKSAMTLHRLMREVDPSFQEQLLRYQDRRGGAGAGAGGQLLLLNLDRYNDHASRETWDYSSWIRAYASYLDERLGCFRAIRFDPESDGQAPAAQRAAQLQRAYREQQQQGGYTMQPTGGFPLQPTGYYGAMPTGGQQTGGAYGNGSGYYGQQQQGQQQPGQPYGNGNGYGAAPPPPPPPCGQQHQNLPPHVQAQLAEQQNPQHQQLRVDLKSCDTAQLLAALPHVQRLLARMLACRPEGAAARHPVPLTSAAWVLRESRAVYRAASEGVMNLADKYFEMGRDDALRALELYKRHVELSDQLSGWFGVLRQNPALSRAIAFPTLQPLPADFLTAMEEYARDAPLEGGPGTQMSPRTAAAAREALAALELPPADDEDAAAAAAALAEEEEAARLADEEAAMETVQEEEEGEEEAAAAEEAEAEEQPQEAPPPPPPAPDLLSFDDEPAPAPAAAEAAEAAAAAAAPAEPASELDALASGMVGEHPHHHPGGAAVAAGVAGVAVAAGAAGAAAADSFGDAPPAFGAAPPPPHQQQQMYGAPPPPYGYQPTGPYAPPGPYGAPYYPQYAPTGGDPAAAYYGGGAGGWPGPHAAAGATGAAAAGSMALVPVGPMGAAPMYPYGAPPPPYAGATGGLVNPYVPGLGPQPPVGVVGGGATGAAAAGGASNPFNPFASAGGATGSQQGPGPSRLTGQRLTNDPLNELTDQLFAAPAAPASPGSAAAAAKGPSMRAMNASASGNGGGGGPPAPSPPPPAA